MKTKLFIIIAVTASIFSVVNAQSKYYTRSGHIYFMSHTDIIDIDANNHQVVSFLDIQTGEMVFAVLMKSFEFTLATAEEHFNETYAESDRYPKAKFTGKILEIDKIDLTKPGKYNVTVQGDLTIKNRTHNITEKGTLEVKGGKIIGKSAFNIAIADYNIHVPKVVEERVAKIVNLKINMEYTSYQN